MTDDGTWQPLTIRYDLTTLYVDINIVIWLIRRE